MATRLVVEPVKDFIGLSTDVKPTQGVFTGSTFYETDTKDYYLWDGANWGLM
jgi:hypothetical protein